MRKGILQAGVIRSGTCVWSDARTGKKRSSIGYDLVTDLDGTGTVGLHYTRNRK